MLGMLGNTLEEQKFYNSKVCFDVSLEKDIKLFRSYCIGNTDQESGKLKIYVNPSYRKKNRIVPSGKSMFLLKGILPYSAVNPEIRREIVKREVIFPGDDNYLYVHIMVLVKENKLSEFKQKVHQVLENKKNVVFTSVSRYGVVKACYFPDLDQKGCFDLQYALENISDVDADFVYQSIQSQQPLINLFSKLTTKFHNDDYQQL